MDFCSGLTNCDGTQTQHADQYIGKRGISPQAIELVLEFGRQVRSRGAIFYVIGKKEIERYHKIEPRLADLNGVQMITSEEDVVITAYCNKDLRSIRPCHRKHAHLH